ncbi:MAG: hypothetical protein WD317_03925, partial [Balneolaceae bacterium]
LVIDRNGYSLYDNDNNEMQRSEIERDDEIDLTGPGMDLDRDHIANFIDSIHEGRKPVSDVSDVNASVHNCHLGNIAHRTGRVINCDPHNGRIIGDPQAEKLYSREYEPGWAPVV